MNNSKRVGRRALAALLEAVEHRQLLSSLSLIAPPDASAVAFTGPDRSTLIYYEPNESYRLTARAPDGTITRLPTRPDNIDSFTYSRGSVFFETRDGFDDPGGRSVARSDGTVAGTRYVRVDSPGDAIERIIELDSQVFLDGYRYYSEPSGRLLFAHDSKLDRFRPIDTDALAQDIGASNVMPTAAGMIDGKRLFFIPRTRSLYELEFPKTGPLRFKEFIRLPASTGDSSGAIAGTFLDGQFYYTTGTRLRTEKERATTAWRSDGTAAGTVKISGAAPRFYRSEESAVSIAARHYVMDGNTLLSFDHSATAFTAVTTIENVDDSHLWAAGDRLYYVVNGQLYTMRPQDGPASRPVSLPAGMRIDSTTDARTMIYGKRYIAPLISGDYARRALLITEGKSSSHRQIELPAAVDGSPSSFSVKAIAGNGDLLVVGNSNQGNGYYSVRISSGDHAPTAVFNGKPSFAEGGGLRLDASGSADADGDALSYAWDLDNDGAFDDFTTTSAVSSVSWGLLKKLRHRDGPDTFRIRVRVSDLEHATVSDEAIVRMKDTPPVLSVTQQKQVRAQTPTELALSFSDAGRDVVSSASIDWGDGKSDVVPVVNGTATASHTYASAGNFSIKIDSTDEDGTRQSYSGTIQVVRQFSGPVLIGGVPAEFDLGYDTFALKDGTMLMERARPDGGVDIVAREADGSPERVIIQNREFVDWQVVGKGAIIMVDASARGYLGNEYYWTNAGGKRTTKIADAHSDKLPALAAEGAYLVGDDNGVKLLDLSTLSITSVRTAKREYPTAYSEIVSWRNKAYFIGSTPKSNGTLSLWRLDVATAVQVSSLANLTSAANLGVAGDRLMIGGVIYELSAAKGLDMVSDGTADGTRVIEPLDSPPNGVVYADYTDFDLTRLYWVNRESKKELWSLDVKSAKARKIYTFVHTQNGSPLLLGQAGKYIYFNADDGTRGEQVWRTDGTPGGTIALGVTMPDDFSDSFEASGGYAYFVGKPTGTKKPRSLWVSDGTPGGMRQVTAGGADLSSASAVVSIAGGVAFTTIRANVLEAWTVNSGATEAKRSLAIDAIPLADGRFSSAAARQVGEIWYVTAHVQRGSKQRDYLWAVYPA